MNDLTSAVSVDTAAGMNSLRNYGMFLKKRCHVCNRQ